MSLPNIHRKLFAGNGSDKMLRSDILPDRDFSYLGKAVHGSHTCSEALPEGSEVSTGGAGYDMGSGGLMVFYQGLKLILGEQYEEVESGEAVIINFAAEEGAVFDFESHGGWEYEVPESEEPEPDEGDGTLEVGESIVYSGGEALAMDGGFIGLTETVIGDEAIGWQNGTMPNGVSAVTFYDLEGNYVKNLEAPYYRWIFSIRQYYPDDEPIVDSSNTLASNPVVFTTSDGRRYQIEATDDSYRTYVFGEDNPVFVLPSGNGVYIDASGTSGSVSELACYSVKITRLEDDRKYGDLDEEIVTDTDDEADPDR